MQETHSNKSKERIWRSQWGGRLIFNHGSSNAQGVLIGFDKNLDIKIESVHKMYQGRVLIIHTDIENQKIIFINIYAPNEENLEFFQEIFQYVEKCTYDHVIMGGDYNKVLNPSIDRKSVTPASNSITSEFLNSYMEENLWVDPWRNFNPDAEQYTWFRKNPTLCMSRLDFFLVPMTTFAYIDKSEIIPGLLSDHSFVSIEFMLEKKIRGKGLWKMNTSYFHDPQYVNTINQIIEDFNKLDTDTNILDCWEQFKIEIAEYSMQHARNKARSRKNRILTMQDLLQQAIKKFNKINLNSPTIMRQIEEWNQVIDALKYELDKEANYIAQGAMIRSRVKWAMEGEHGSKYFLNLEKSQSAQKTMTKVCTDAGVTKNTKMILVEQAKYFKRLYQSNPEVTFQLKTSLKTQISEEQKANMKCSITLDEIAENLKATKLKKTPGPDGIPVDFYIMFWPQLKGQMYKLIKYISENKRLHESARKGIISLIPKKGSDMLWVKNWRPIILLNADYKLYSKIIATRLKNILETIIHPDQAGFMAGRNIGQNLRRIYDTISYTKKNSIDAILISLDFEKAFDRLEYNSLYGALGAFGVPQEFIDLVKPLFTDFKLATVNGGFFSEWFTPTRGVFQGNCISPYAFITVIELLAIELRASDKIEGIDINEIRNLLSQFADDMQMFMKYSKTSLQETINILSNFEQISGMKVNYDKTAIYRIGSLAKSQAKLYVTREFQWTTDPLNILGLTVSNDIVEDSEENIQQALTKTKNVLKMWQTRNISLIGKIQIINSLVASLFVYKLTVLLDLTAEHFTMLDNLFNDFIWNGGKPKIKLNTLSAPRQSGGLNLANMRVRNKSLKAQWITFCRTNPLIEAFEYELLNNEIGDLLWKCQFVKEDVKYIVTKTHSLFWYQVLQAWAEFNFDDPISCAQVKSQILWFNSNIRINGNPTLCKDWYEKGINTVQNLLTADNRFLSYQEFCDKYNFYPQFTEYYGIISAIPKWWRRWLKEPHGPENFYLYDEIKKYKKTISSLYQLYFKQKDMLIDVSYKWQKRVDPDITSDTLIKALRDGWKVTNIAKLRSFHYRIITQSLVTNVQLYYYKIKMSKNCTFCGEYEETVRHLFVDCQASNMLRKYIKDISVNCPNCMFGTKEILINSIHRNPYHPLNTVCLIYKYFIYSRRCADKSLSTQVFKNYLQLHIDLEYSIACKNNKKSRHNLKWKDLVL